MAQVSNDPPCAVAVTSLWQRFLGWKRERKREVFCLLLCWKSLPGASETSLLAGHSSFLFPQIISSHAPVLWSLWGLPWLSHPCKSRGQPQPPVLGNICPQNEGFTQALFSCLALLQSSKGSRVAKRLFLEALVGDHSRFACAYLMLSNDQTFFSKKCKPDTGLWYSE